MGKGIDAGRDMSPELANLLDDLKDQLLLVMVERLGGKADIPVAEVDATGGKVLLMEFDLAAQTFRFELRKKQ